jgi:Fe-S-cluster-containing dehydrogenase component
MKKETTRYGLLIDYEYCTGCFACEVACAQEFKRKAGTIKGIKVIEIEQRLSQTEGYLTYLPFPTENCVLCPHLTRKGGLPACVKACMASCMKYGPVDQLAKEMNRKPRLVLWAHR